MRPESLPPAALIGQYQLIERLGAAVDKVWHADTSRLIVLRWLDSREPTTDDKIQFEREMQGLARLAHPQIAVTLEVGEFNGAAFVAQPLVEGRNLGGQVRTKGPLSVTNACRVVRSAAQILAAAHARGLVHGGICPENLLIDEKGQLHLLDFGVVLLEGHSTFADPESSGETRSAVTDLFALGCTLYSLIAGRPPSRVLDCSGIPDGVAGIIERLVARNPESRIQTATALAEMLEPLTQKPKPGELPPVSGSSKTGKASRKATHAGGATASVPQVAKTANSSAKPGTHVRRRLQLWLLGAAIAVVALASLPMMYFAAAKLVQVGVEPPKAAIALAPAGPTPPREAPKAVAAEVATAPAKSVAQKSAAGSAAKAAASVAPVVNPPVPKPVAAGNLVPEAPDPILYSLADWKGWAANSPPPAIAPFTPAEAARHQAAWGKQVQAETVFTNSLGTKFVLIPPGEFLMGSGPAEIEAAAGAARTVTAREQFRSEGPQHKVILTQPFYVGMYEVTQGEFEALTGKNPSQCQIRGTANSRDEDFETRDHPVENVSMEGVTEFIAALNAHEALVAPATMTGPLDAIRAYRLPTEAEWEFACRAGSTTAFVHGADDEHLPGWHEKNSRSRTHAVGELAPNPFGLFDVHGNVAEFVADTLLPDAYGRFAQPVIDPFVSGGVLFGGRGGHWQLPGSLCRSACRQSVSAGPNVRRAGFGFRLVLPVEAVKLLRQRNLPAPELRRKPAEPMVADMKVPVSNWQMPVRVPVGESPLDKLDPAEIPADERFAYQPKELVALIGSHARRHWGEGQGAAISPDKKWAATGSRREVIIWDLATHQPKWRFLSGSRYVSDQSLAFTPDSEQLLYDPGFFDLRTGKQNEFSGGLTSTERLGLGDGGKTIVNQSNSFVELLVLQPSLIPPLPGKRNVLEGWLKTVDKRETRYAVDGSSVTQLSGKTGLIVYLTKEHTFRQCRIVDHAFADDRLLDIPLPPPGKEFARGDPADCVALGGLSADGKTLAILGDDHVEIWNLGDHCTKRFDLPLGLARMSAVSPDGRWFVASNHRGTTLHRIDEAQPREIARLDPADPFHGDVAFSEDGTLLIVNNEAGFVRFWELTGDAAREAAPFDPATAFGRFSRRDQQNPIVMNRSELLLERLDPPDAARFQLWDLAGSRPAPSAGETTFLDLESPDRPSIRRPPGLAAGDAKLLDFGPDDLDAELQRAGPDAVAVISKKGKVGWHGFTNPGWTEGHNLTGTDATIAQISPDCRLLLTDSRKPGVLSVRDLLSQDHAAHWTVDLPEPKGRDLEWNRFIISDNRRVLAAIRQEGEYGLRQLLVMNDFLTQPSLALELSIPRGEFRSQPNHVALSPDGKVVVHNLDRVDRLTITDLVLKGNRQEGKTMGIEHGDLRWLAFSPDGMHLAYAAANWTGVLELSTLKTVWKWMPPSPSHWVDWAPDGRHLYIHNGNHTIYVVRLNALFQKPVK